MINLFKLMKQHHINNDSLKTRKLINLTRIFNASSKNFKLLIETLKYF